MIELLLRWTTGEGRQGFAGANRGDPTEHGSRRDLSRLCMFSVNQNTKEAILKSEIYLIFKLLKDLAPLLDSFGLDRLVLAFRTLDKCHLSSICNNNVNLFVLSWLVKR